jgi:hypothetical protein
MGRWDGKKVGAATPTIIAPAPVLQACATQPDRTHENFSSKTENLSNDSMLSLQ